MKREHLATDALTSWAKFNGITFEGVRVEHTSSERGQTRGAGVVASRDHGVDNNRPINLIVVPEALVLSLDLVNSHAKADRHLRDLLLAIGEFGKTPRGAILSFLLMQITHSSPDVAASIGVLNPLTEYVKFLPIDVRLPTFYSEREQELLSGTSLEPALQAKLKSLSREYELLRESTQELSWCRRAWWDKDTFSLDDWKIVDAWYRSRALDLPGTGHSMIPCIDMANHASRQATVGLYETDRDGNAVLQLIDQKALTLGEEVTITYGDDKGACEMMFSYGFLEESVDGARELFLDLEIPDDDPLKLAKLRVSNSPPGFKLFEVEGDLDWSGDFIWWSCVNEEDGLDFQVLLKTDGERELRVTWKGEELRGDASLKEHLEKDGLWDLFQLRVAVILQSRLDVQIAKLNESQGIVQASRSDPDIKVETRADIVKLRTLEWQLLARGYQKFENMKRDLLGSKTVQTYFESNQDTTIEPTSGDDFA